jgi:hypothetical protein
MPLLGTECFANVSGRGEFMARSSQPDLFVTESQSELFRCGGNSSYRPDTGKVRARLHEILAEARAAQTTAIIQSRIILLNSTLRPCGVMNEATELKDESTRGRGG